MKSYWGVYFAPPEGTTDNAAGSGGASASGGVSSGTASDAMIAAATAASSAADASASAAGGVKESAGAKPATTEPAKGAAGAGTGNQGPIPFDRHEAAVRNAREEGMREATDKAVREYAWAKGLDPEDVKRKIGLAAQMATDPRKFYDDLGKELKEHGFLDQPDEKMPEPDLIDPTGKIKTYSVDAFQKALNIGISQAVNKLRTELRPTIEFAKTEEGRRTQAEQRSQVQSLVSATMADVRALEHFPKLADGKRDAAGEAKILEELRSIPAEVKAAIGPVAALYKAFESYKAKHVYPTLNASAEARVRAENDKKAAAAMGHIGTTDKGGEGKRPDLKNVSDLSAHMERLAAATV